MVEYLEASVLMLKERGTPDGFRLIMFLYIQLIMTSRNPLPFNCFY